MDNRNNVIPDFSAMMQNVPSLQFHAKVNPFIYNTTKIIDTTNLPECNLADVIVSAPIDESTAGQTKRILETFNADIKKGQSCFTKSSIRGDAIPSGNLFLGVRNTKAELHGPSTTPVARSLTMAVGVKSEIVNKGINQSDKIYGEHGKYVLNVPAGYYVKASSGNTQQIYGQGCHVIIDANFKLANQSLADSMVEQSQPYIHHGTIHILRIPTNKYAKISIGADAYILPGRQQPYVFNDPLFKLAPKSDNTIFHDQTEQYIHHGIIHILRVPVGKLAKIWMGQDPYFLQGRSDPYVVIDPQFRLVFRNGEDFLFDPADQYIEHGNRHILRIPQGKYAKVWIGNTALLLFSQEFPYYIDDPLFKLEKDNNRQFLFNQTDSYISHGTQHLIRVPEGKIAKIWLGSVASLLKTGEYFFHDPNFRLETKDNNELFFDATSRLIAHGSLKRVIPHTGEIAIAYNNGKLNILIPKESGEPYMLNSATDEVTGFMQTGIETLIFPSEETKRQRAYENNKLSPDEVSLECFTTRDSLKVGVKLLVAFKIADPQKALSILINEKGILKHIENVATVDMGKAIQKCTSQEFLNFYHTQPQKDNNNSSPLKPIHYQDEVKDALAKDLAEYGIELVRLNVETPKILDTKIADEMAEASISSAKSNAKESTLEQSYRIAKRSAEQEAETRRIAQEQQNQTIVSQAEAKLKAADLNKQATIMEAEAEKEALLRRAEAEAKSIELKAEAQKKAMDMQGTSLSASPALLELKIAEVKAEAISKAQLSLTSPELATLFARNTLGFFGANLTAATPRVLHAKEGGKPSGISNNQYSIQNK